MNTTISRLTDIVPQAQRLINRLSHGLSTEQLSLYQSEQQLLTFVNEIGALLLRQTLGEVSEPTDAPRVELSDGRVARYKGQSPLSFISRFGHRMSIPRRRYVVEGSGESWYPMDEALGMDRCAGFSPLLSYLVARGGATEAFAPAAQGLSEALGFPISGSAVQCTTEATGNRLPHNPLHAIPSERQNQGCDLFVVEMDGILSPQIAAGEQERGREVLSRPTEYKECTVAVIRKENPGEVLFDTWYGGQYGARERFREYLHQGAIAMGQLLAHRVVFVADGARHNWELCWDLFPDAIQILDIYHAWEHLGKFCAQDKDPARGKRHYREWHDLIWQGRILEVRALMQAALFRDITDRDEAQKHLSYFRNNQERMRYDEYRSQGLPCGSGIVEGACKSVVAKRFKGCGMRWRRKDNEQVLETRLAYLNGSLPEAFLPAPQQFRPLPRVVRFAA